MNTRLRTRILTPTLFAFIRVIGGLEKKRDRPQITQTNANYQKARDHKGTGRRYRLSGQLSTVSAALLVIFLGIGTPFAATSKHSTPEWTKTAIWYQIFPERFRNGDPNNDPVRESLEGTWPYIVPQDWDVSPWTSDWYRLQPWEINTGKDFYYVAQLRRYGGDLQGVLDKLDYLQELGVTALYLNPIFESASLHKYGATLYHHVDKHFGPNPKGDKKLLENENPADPKTWAWTAADRQFLKLIEAVHRRNMRIIIDGVFNHVGIPFWAFQRARSEGPDSQFTKWFHINAWDDPKTTEDEFDYQGWVGVKDLPEFRKGTTGPHPEVKAHFQAVLGRWMDPNGDGDPSDGIDGWRLDVAEHLPIAFWEEFRGWVKAINPEAYLTGEVWWENYNEHEYKNAAPYLGNAFDGVMNYRFGDALFRFFNEAPAPISSRAFASLIQGIHRDYGFERSLALQNLMNSHDTSRIGSAVVNPDCRQDHRANLDNNRSYRIRKPNASEREVLKLMIAFQFCAPGAPYIYYGDEVGMWGADDPDCRKPMVWRDLKYETETTHPFGLPRQQDPVTVDGDLLGFYKQMTQLRQRSPELQTGSMRLITFPGQDRIVAIVRTNASTTTIAAFNADQISVTISSGDLGIKNPTNWNRIWGPPADTHIDIRARQFGVWTRSNRE